MSILEKVKNMIIINYINLLKDSGAYFTDAQDKKLNKILVVNDTASIS